MKNNRKIAMLYSSKNDYNILEEILYKKSFKGIEDIFTVNIDCDSSLENKIYGQKFCDKYGILNLNIPFNGSIPMQKCVEETFKYFDDNNLDFEWLFVAQHDIFISHDNFWDLLENRINNDTFLNKVGTIGFAVKNLPNENDICYGRGNLIDGMIGKRDGFMINLPETYNNVDYFVVESSWYVGWLINRKLFKKYITPDYNFILNFWGDDIAHQFLSNDIFNITIPDLLVIDDWRYKTTLGIPHCNKGYNKFYHGDHWNHHDMWNKKYGYHMYYADRNFLKAENERKDCFMMYRRKYAGTLIDKIFNLHINDGPKKIEDF